MTIKNNNDTKDATNCWWNILDRWIVYSDSEWCVQAPLTVPINWIRLTLGQIGWATRESESPEYVTHRSLQCRIKSCHLLGGRLALAAAATTLGGALALLATLAAAAFLAFAGGSATAAFGGLKTNALKMKSFQLTHSIFKQKTK